MKIEAATRLKAASKAEYIAVLKKCFQIDGEATHVDDQCATFRLHKYPDMSYIRFLDHHAGKAKRGSSNTDLIYTWTGLDGVGVRLYLPKDMSKDAHLEIYNRDEAYASATHRVLSMTIQQGDNFPDAKKNAKDVLGYAGSEFEVLDQLDGMVLLRHEKGLAVRYVLVNTFDTAKLKTSEKLKDLVKEVKGYMAVLRFPNTDEVHSVFVAESMRGRGLGKQLYGIAHKYSKKGLQSSEDLGTMSLGTWLSLYKANEAIRIVVDGKPCPRAEIAVDGLNIKWTKKGKAVDLVGAKLPMFTFFWKK